MRRESLSNAEGRKLLSASILERDFQVVVLELAARRGWTRAHFRPARTEKGWRTPVAADGKGFPDLVLVRDRVLFRELKRDHEKVRPEQEMWLGALLNAGADARVWRPKMWREIEEQLR